MATKRKAKQLYFTRHDADLEEAINSIPKGDQNHEIRKALRHWFLGEGTTEGRPMFQQQEKQKPEEDNTELLSSINFEGMIR